MGNLLAAVRNDVLPTIVVADWARIAIELVADKGARPQTAAFVAVWENASTFQKLGNEVPFGEPRLLVFSTASRIEQSLADQVAQHPVLDRRPRGSAGDLAAFVREQAIAKATFQLFHPERLVWYARRDAELAARVEDIAAGAASSSPGEAAVALLRYLGLPLMGGEEWLMIDFDLTLTTAPIALRCPTALDGVDGLFFKQLSQGARVDGWGRTADLDRLSAPSAAQLDDGAFEGVGLALPIAAVADCTILPRLPRLSVDDDVLHGRFAELLLRQVLPTATAWEDLALELDNAL